MLPHLAGLGLDPWHFYSKMLTDALVLILVEQILHTLNRGISAVKGQHIALQTIMRDISSCAMITP